MFGIINLHKPAGITSRDAVNHVQRLIRPIKVGHAGTLDPIACGVLLVAVGQASRLVPYLHQLPKCYRAVFEFGKSSVTDDIEGEVVDHPELPMPTTQAVQAACARFVGPIQQRPPAYSAIKVDGKRAYELARSGQALQLPEREVLIHRIDVLGFQFPKLTLEIECGSGTYVRSIGRDVAAALGTKAIMTALSRTSIGNYRLEDAVAMDNLCDAASVGSAILPATGAVAHLPKVELDRNAIVEIQHGRLVRSSRPTDAAEIAAVDQQGRLRAILIPRIGGLGPKHVFHVD